MTTREIVEKTFEEIKKAREEAGTADFWGYSYMSERSKKVLDRLNLTEAEEEEIAEAVLAILDADFAANYAHSFWYVCKTDEGIVSSHEKQGDVIYTADGYTQSVRDNFNEEEDAELLAKNIEEIYDEYMSWWGEDFKEYIVEKLSDYYGA